MTTIANSSINNSGNAININTFEDGSNLILDANPIPMKKMIRRKKYSALEFAEVFESKRKKEMAQKMAQHQQLLPIRQTLLFSKIMLSTISHRNLN